MDLQNQSPLEPHIAFFPCLGFGRFVAITEFSKRLSALHGFTVTIINLKWMRTPRQDDYMQRVASSGFHIRFTELPDVPFPEENEDMKIETRMSMFMEKTKPYIGEVLESLLSSPSPISALVTAFFSASVLDLAAKIGIPLYIFFASNASVLSIMFSLPQLVAETKLSFKDMDTAVEVPGLPPIPARDLPTPLQDRSQDAFSWFVHHFSGFKEATGILVNSFVELEEEPFKALREGNYLSVTTMPTIYPVGPVISSESDLPDDSDCLKWLDQQPPSSVLFICFGSRAVLSIEQIREAALGLEASGHRFLWVVRGPHKDITFSPKHETDISHLLPEGFENRTKDRGLVVPFWAPQIPILSHPSTGGFLSHCGWNSTLESISCGVPVITWPMFAEQRLNRFILAKIIKVAIELKMETDGFVKKEEVERAVKELMEGNEGKQVREKMAEMKEKAKTAIAKGGSSYKALEAAATDFVHVYKKAGIDYPEADTTVSSSGSP